MTAERVKVFGAALLACFAALCGSAHGQTLNVRQLAVTTAVENASIPASAPLRWYQGESLVFRHYSTQGGTNANWSTLANLIGVWTVVANQTEDPDNTNAYLYSTGVVTAASGLVSFAVSPEMSAMPASNYWSYVTLYQTDETGATNNYIGVLHRSAAVVGYRMIHPVYTGPYPIPTNGVSIDPTARALAASNTALIVAETNRAQVAEAGINATATNALAIVQSLQSSGLITGTQASNITASILSTGTAHYATTAGGIAFEGEGSSLTVIPSNGVLHVRTVTNSTSAYLRSTNGAPNYNGPPIGTVWTEVDTVGLHDSGEWVFIRDETSYMGVFHSVDERLWNTRELTALPAWFYPTATATGQIEIAYVPLTNTYIIGDMTGYLANIAVNGVTGTVANGIASVTIPAGGVTNGEPSVVFGKLETTLTNAATTNFIGRNLFIKSVSEQSGYPWLYFYENGSRWEIRTPNGSARAIDLFGAGNVRVGYGNGGGGPDKIFTFGSPGFYPEVPGQQLGYSTFPWSSVSAYTANVTRINLGAGQVYIGSTNSWIYSDGTNLFFRNVNGVTNALTSN